MTKVTKVLITLRVMRKLLAGEALQPQGPKRRRVECGERQGWTLVTCLAAFGPLLGQTVRTSFEWGRIQTNTDWVLPIVAAVLLMLFVRAMYRRDSVEIPAAWGWLLTALRTAVVLGLLVLYLQPRWRAEQEEVRNSRVLLLADTSSSMGLVDDTAAFRPAKETGEAANRDAPAAKGDGPLSRERQVTQALKQGDFLAQLRRVHDVVLYRFDRELNRVATLDKVRPEPVAEDAAKAAAGGSPGPQPATVDWEKSFVPAGSETRLGQALRQLVYDEQNSPLSGIVVFSDGGQNAGISPEAAAEMAQEARVPIFTVGVGSDRLPTNVRVYRVESLPRAYPGDPYTVSGLIQSQGRSAELAGRPVTVELLTREAGNGKSQPGTGTGSDRQQVVLGAGGESVPVKFQMTPKETGRRTLCLRVVPPPGDHNPADDFRETEVDVVDRKDRVLLLAGGPTREYGFLRPLLFRDKSMVVDVLLDTAQAGMSQEANQVLDAFPSTREQLYAYDCLVAFDPDWSSLTAEQIDLLEGWVAEQAGGLVVLAGPVYMGEAVHGWTQDSAMAKIRALYPVEFFRRSTTLDIATLGSKEPWPLDFTREGLEAEFLWLEDDEASNQQAWGSFAGVYSYFPVRGPKPAATVYARFSDPQAAAGGSPPVYMAEQFYGSGRVFYLGSGEMWRLRKLDEGYFERFYTRLIRHVAQGRLLRQSSRGMLMVAQDQYSLGSTAEIRAQLTNAQLAPLESPGVTLDVFLPSGSVQNVTLRADPSRPGAFVGQLTLLQEGVYRFELPVPESADERLSRRVQVSLPDLERQNPQRNDKLLAGIADATGGRHYASVQSALSTSSPDSLLALLKDRTKTIITPAAPNPEWERNWLQWMMYILCGLLCLEWLIRRLWKLA